MAKQDNKKKSPIALFSLAFVVIVILMFIANYRSAIVEELLSPERGVKKLSTYGKQLVAISPDNEVYVWSWDNLSNGPQIGSVNAQKVAAVSGNRLLWVPIGIFDVLIVGNLKGDKELSRLSLGLDKRCKLLQASSNGKYAAAALTAEDPIKQIQLVIIDPDLNYIRSVETKTMEEGLKLNDIGISNDGTLIATVGGGDKGYLWVAGVNDEQLNWEYYVEDCNELNKVAISTDGRMVYAAESGRWVYIFDTSAKKLTKRLEIDKYETPANNPQTITSVALSPDGRLLAAVSSPSSKVWIWDAESGERISSIRTGDFSTSAIVFSPDSNLLAGADLTKSPVKVWRISKSP